uniref:Uncharacterized protein n=1 Tax=Meloidogyne hapla TaxID=6305 RepID=A0A1I8B845_MELHA
MSLTEINVNDPCECVDNHLKPECRGMYDDNKQLAKHFTNVFFALNEKEFIRNYLAIAIIIWHRKTKYVLKDNKARNKSTQKFRIWALETWGFMQNELDKPYCKVFDIEGSSEYLEFIDSNFPRFFYLFSDSIKGIGTNEFANRNKNINRSSFKEKLQV